MQKKSRSDFQYPITNTDHIIDRITERDETETECGIAEGLLYQRYLHATRIKLSAPVTRPQTPAVIFSRDGHRYTNFAGI